MTKNHESKADKASVIVASNSAAQKVLQAANDGNLSLLQQTVPPSLLWQARCKSGCTALHWAAGNNQPHCVHHLLLLPSQQRGDNDGSTTCPSLVDTVATGKARGRTALHYACRNGHLDMARLLVERYGATADARAKHGVTPFQLAVWQNHLDICQWLVNECGVDASQTNDFACGAVHWIGICPKKKKKKCASETSNTESPSSSSSLLPLAKWLATQPGIDFHQRQRQGHTPLHKAAWGGHLELLQYLHTVHGLMDDSPDDAGNYAADLAEMARHSVDNDGPAIITYLRTDCSTARQESCRILGVPVHAGSAEIRKAYLTKARLLHPDRRQCGQEQNDESPDDSRRHGHDHVMDNPPVNDEAFDRLRKAYEHLTIEDGIGKQCNPAHSLPLMLQLAGRTNHPHDEKSNSGGTAVPNDNTDCFKARLIAVLLEYGDKGLDVSNVAKKWKQVWPDTPFPYHRRDFQKQRGDNTNSNSGNNHGKGLTAYLLEHAGDVVDIVYGNNNDKGPNGTIKVVPKNVSRRTVESAAATTITGKLLQ